LVAKSLNRLKNSYQKPETRNQKLYHFLRKPVLSPDPGNQPDIRAFFLTMRKILHKAAGQEEETGYKIVGKEF
jgi:hypothetical protein